MFPLALGSMLSLLFSTGGKASRGRYCRVSKVAIMQAAWFSWGVWCSERKALDVSSATGTDKWRNHRRNATRCHGHGVKPGEATCLALAWCPATGVTWTHLHFFRNTAPGLPLPSPAVLRINRHAGVWMRLSFSSPKGWHIHLCLLLSIILRKLKMTFFFKHGFKKCLFIYLAVGVSAAKHTGSFAGTPRLSSCNEQA